MGPICAAINSVGLNKNCGLFASGGASTVNRLQHSQNTQVRQLDAASHTIGAPERMPTGTRELVLAQAAAANSFWARQSIKANAA